MFQGNDFKYIHQIFKHQIIQAICSNSKFVVPIPHPMSPISKLPFPQHDVPYLVPPILAKICP